MLGHLSLAAADPPPWAPAHGHRANNAAGADGRTVYYDGPQRRYYDDGYFVYRVPYGIDRGVCDRPALSHELTGGMIGGVAGGLIGHQVGKDTGRTVASVGGIVIGALVGSAIGRQMDEVDQTCVAYALEHAPDRQRIVWNNTENGNEYAVVPTRTYQRDDRYCREYSTTATIAGKDQTVNGTACRQSDGTWRLVN